ncbi:MAG: hypothetical protein ACYDCJ_01680 [Gammaproteobacteria bacterium]
MSAKKLHNATAIPRDYEALGDALWNRFKGGKPARCGITAPSRIVIWH